jgi:hypothetical protein
MSWVSPIRPDGCIAVNIPRISGGSKLVLTTPGATAFTRNSACGVFDRQRAGRRSKATLGERGERCRQGGQWLIRNRRRDADDMAGPGLQHPRRRLLSDMEDASQIYADHRGEVVQRIINERFWNENASVVYKCIDSSETLHRRVDDSCSGIGLTDVSLDPQSCIIASRPGFHD